MPLISEDKPFKWKVKRRYKLLSNGGLMIMRRWWPGRWKDHENFDNQIHRLEQSLSDHWDAMLADHAAIEHLLRKKKKIIADVNKANGNTKGLGDAFDDETTHYFSEAYVAKPPDLWKVAFSGRPRISRGPHAVEETWALADSGQQSGVQVWPLTPDRSANANQGKGGNNNRNNNRN